jgi:predicted dithiol-disulfide oxidoreductase (DUF899 family)
MTTTAQAADAGVRSEIESLERQLQDIHEKLAQARRRTQPEAVRDYPLFTSDGASVTLSSLFRGKRDLLVVHNMGKKCVYCTLWADGLIGFSKHLSDRAGFVLCSPDEPTVLKEFASSRGWPFACVSSHGSTFTRDMGYEHVRDGKVEHWPGVSAFRKNDDGSISRVNRAMFGPGDSFCALWHLFDLLKDGAAGWSPKYTYA